MTALSLGVSLLVVFLTNMSPLRYMYGHICCEDFCSGYIAATYDLQSPDFACPWDIFNAKIGQSRKLWYFYSLG